MTAFLVRRLIRLVLVLWGVITLLFLAERLAGDPAQFLLSGQAANPQTLALFRHQLGLDQPLGVQYLHLLWRILHGDLGRSLVYQRPARALVLERLPKTAELAGAATVVGVIVSVPVGVFAAVRRGKAADSLSMLLVQVGQAMPVFWLALILVLVFAVRLHWFPVVGSTSLKAYVLPAVCLGVYFAATVARVTRSAMLDVLGQDYIRTARSKGLDQKAIYIRHALRNAAAPVLTIISLQFGVLLGGAVIVEEIFLWPGVGTLLLQAINSHDYPVMEAGVFIFAFAFVCLNFVVDVLYTTLDPRIRL